MKSIRAKNIIKYVVPTMLGNVCFFLFTIIDGIFVGRGVGTDALGAVNIAFPFVMAVNALFMLINIGGVSISAVKLGQGDADGAGRVFRQSMFMLTSVSVVLCATGVFFADAICVALGADDTFREFASDCLFWYSLFIIPSGLSMGLQTYCRNDGAPGLVGVAVIASTGANVFLDWLFIYPLRPGTGGAAVATGISQTIALLIVMTHFLQKKACFASATRGLTQRRSRILSYTVRPRE